jgi:hypothetical protein
MGAEFLLLVIGCEAVVHPKEHIELEFCQRLGVSDLHYADRRCIQLGEQHSFAVYPLSRPMQKFARRSGEHLHGFPNTTMGTGHWNARGHAVAAGAIAPVLCDMLEQSAAQ